MTTIAPLARPSNLPSFKVAAFARGIFGAAGCAMLVGVAGVASLVCFTARAEMEQFFARSLEHRIRQIVPPSISCGSDGAQDNGSAPNCYDHRGFRVVAGDRVSVYSMRYQKPLFVFGLEKGFMFVNHKIPSRLMEGEKSSFLAYMVDTTR
jgi:hypothetical protein